MRNSYFEGVIISFEHESIEKLPCIQHQWCEQCFYSYKRKIIPLSMLLSWLFQSFLRLVPRFSIKVASMVYHLFLDQRVMIMLMSVHWFEEYTSGICNQYALQFELCVHWLVLYYITTQQQRSALRHLAYGKWVHECAHNVESIGKARYVQLFLSQASFSEASQKRALNVFIQIIRTDVLAPFLSLRNKTRNQC